MFQRKFLNILLYRYAKKQTSKKKSETTKKTHSFIKPFLIFKSIKTHNKQTKIESVSKKKKNKVKDTQKQTKNMQIKVNTKYMLKKHKNTVP